MFMEAQTSWQLVSPCSPVSKMFKNKNTSALCKIWWGTTHKWCKMWHVRFTVSTGNNKAVPIFNITHQNTRKALNLRDQLTGNSETAARGCESGNTALVAGAGSAAKLATTGWLLCSSLAVTMATGVTELLSVGVPRPPLGWFPLKYKSSSGCLRTFHHWTVHACIM